MAEYIKYIYIYTHTYINAALEKWRIYILFKFILTLTKMVMY